MPRKLRADLIRLFKDDGWDPRKGVMVLSDGTLVPVRGSREWH